MAKAVKTVASVVGVVAGVALIATGVGAPLGLGLTTASLTAIATAASLVGGIAGMLSKPRGASAGTASRLQASLIPSTPRVAVHGRTAMATDIRYEEYVGSEQEYLWRVFAVASHRVHSIQELWLDEKLAWTSASGVTAAFSGYLTVTPILEANAGNVVNISPSWNAAANRRLTGCALLYVRFKRTGNSKKAESPFAQSITTRVTIIGEGRLYYDPRRDSTVPGGSGPMRANDQSTWAYLVGSDAIGRNGALGLLNHLLGWRINGKLAVGRGVPPARLDLPSFVTAANLCDEAIAKAGGGSEPRYRTDGIVTEDEDGSAVIQRWEGAINGRLIDDGGRLSLRVWHNDLSLPVRHFTADDVLGGAQWDPTIGLDQDRNIGRGRYVDITPSGLGQLIDYPQITLPSADGIDRVLSADFDLVQSPGQAQRLIKQRLQRLLYGGRFTADFRATAWGVKRGDVVTLDFYPLAFAGKLFRVLERSVSIDGRSRMVLSVEHPSIYAWDREEAPSVQPPVPDSYDWRNNPLLVAIDEVEALPGPAGPPGASAFTLIGATGEDLDIRPNTVTKARGSTGWIRSSVFRTAEIFANGCALSFRVSSDAGNLNLGLWNRTTPDESIPPQQLADFSWQVSPEGQIQAFQGGSFLGAHGQASGQQLGLDYDNRFVTWSVDGAEVERVEVGPDGAFYARGIMRLVGSTVSNFTWAKAGARGQDGRTSVVEGSPNGTDPWNRPPQFGDRYVRFSDDGGTTFGTPILIEGEQGLEGEHPQLVFRRSATQPAAPSGNGIPAGWSDGIPAPNGLMLWMTQAMQRDGVSLVPWSTPITWEGQDGEDGFSLETDTPVFVVPAFSGGAIKPSWTGGSGLVQLREGGQVIVPSGGYSIVPGSVSNVADVAMTGNTFSFSAPTAARGSFTVRATHQGQPYDRRIAVNKVEDGSAAFQGSADVGGDGAGAGQSPVPGNRTARVSAYVAYQVTGGQGSYRARIRVFYRNVTDNGPEVFMGEMVGSTSTRLNQGTVAEPDWIETPGEASFSGTFASASADKIYAYRVETVTDSASSGVSVARGGRIKLEVVT